jgi:integrase
VNRRREIKGVTVYPENGKWAYRVASEPDPLTGRRIRPYKGGFPTEEAALRQAIEAKKILDAGRSPHPEKIRVREYFQEWLKAIEPNLKNTAAQSYRDINDAYIEPILGQRWLKDLTVPRINAFYRHLLDGGRRKDDSNERMYQVWLQHRGDRNGLGPKPSVMAAAGGTNLAGAQRAARRFRAGRTPKPYSPGLSAKTVRNVHVVMSKALHDAVAWGYLPTNPTEHAVVPKIHKLSDSRKVWTVEELGRWLDVALQDRFAGMWVLAATTGMRRSELAGVTKQMLDLDSGRLRVEGTRVVVAGRPQESDGKSAAGRRGISLDSFTCAKLRDLLGLLASERRKFGKDYPSHGLLMVNELGRPLHPDTITTRFNRLVDRAGVPHIRLHDVRHTYATLAMDEGVDPKTLSDRLGHANTSVTLQIYTHRSHGRDTVMAQALGDLIQSALTPEDPHESPVVRKLVRNHPDIDSETTMRDKSTED